jgi:ABC-type dipeptide/oligopeptide/nickel transport system ATPase subunit
VTQTRINIPGFGELDGEAPIVILGPNGSGKTQLGQKIAERNQVSAISAQRRTWVDDSLPVQEEQQLRTNVRAQIDRWRYNSWQPTEEINFILSTLIQDHTNLLTKKNQEAIDSGKPLDPVKDTKLILLQGLWNRLFPKRKLEIGGFFPKVKRLDASAEAPSYQLRQMSDGERTVLYMAARVMTAEHPVILVDEPELHMHSRLAVQFWDEAEALRPDCRFVYITHDLNFTLSRRRATVLIARSSDSADVILVDQLPSSIAADVLGAATLPFYAKRIFLFEGESGKGFASEFFSAWFDDDETFAIPCGDRDSVCSAVSGLKAVGVVAAEVIGLIDRDFYSDAVLGAVTNGVTVLSLHEIESVLCDKKAVASVAEHFGKDPAGVSEEFLDRVRKEFRGQTLNSVVARRVRSRVGDLLDGAFNGAQVVGDFKATSENHSKTLSALDLPTRTDVMFAEESKRVSDALDGGGREMLAILPGKHLLNMLAGVLGLSNTPELTSLIVRSLNRKQLKEDDPLLVLGAKVETALLAYLPSRRA